jgi:pSer/pThr/pTyr-binding forkhead associated (FHA) protein
MKANPRIMAISGPLKGIVFPLGRAELIIGKGRSCGVRLDDPLVSTRHCGICHEAEQAMLWDMGSSTGTFVNGFCFSGQILQHGDRIRVGCSIFVYLDREDAEVDAAMVALTPAEEDWDRKLKSGQRTAGYEAATATVLDAFLNFNGKINALRDPDEIQSHALDLIFRVIPVQRAAILLSGRDGDGILSTTYRRIGSQHCEPFHIDDAVTQKALRDGSPFYGEKVVCFPLVTPHAKAGLIYAAMWDKGAQWFTAGHMRLLEAIAASTTVALEHARYVTWLEGENRRLNEAINVEHGMVGRSEKDAAGLSAHQQSRPFGSERFDNWRKRNGKGVGRESSSFE